MNYSISSVKKICFLKTILKLGILNIIYVFYYRISLRSGLRKYLFPVQQVEFKNDLFKSTEPRKDFPEVWKQQLISDAEKINNGQIRYFAYHWKQVNYPHDWFLNPFNGATYPNSNQHWTKLPDFNSTIGDIKNVWEASRFEWLITLSRAYSVTGEVKYLQLINNWIRNWNEKNPLNIGPNWKCGQEASIRVFNLLNSAIILDQWQQPSKELADFIYLHLQRIRPNIRYAIAQDNNHGTSEAAALFIGGSWLAIIDSDRYPKANRYSKRGREWLENRVSKLIGPDGSFSQHSVNYHRVLLDTLSFSEYWRIKLNQTLFTSSFNEKSKAAIQWLYSMCNEKNGNCPNLGSNDGALFLNMHSCTYRDFRPSIQLAGMLFHKTRIYPIGIWDEPLFWFRMRYKENIQNTTLCSGSKVFKGGYTIIRSNETLGLIRWPNFRFRPSHNDVFHFDLWFKNENILCDAGTYSYHPAMEEETIDLSSVNHHNTVSFDDIEPMPKISRFLLSNWIKPKHISDITIEGNGKQTWRGSYKDAKGNHHERIIETCGNNYTIHDKLSGTFQKATLGFNLSMSSECTIEKGTLITSFGEIRFPENSEVIVVDTIVSDYYMEKHLTKRLQITVKNPGAYMTQIICNK